MGSRTQTPQWMHWPPCYCLAMSSNSAKGGGREKTEEACMMNSGGHKTGCEGHEDCNEVCSVPVFPVRQVNKSR